MNKIRDEYARVNRRDSKRKDKAETLRRKAIRLQKFATDTMKAA